MVTPTKTRRRAVQFMNDRPFAQNPLLTRLEQSRVRFLNRFYARWTGFSRPVTAFVSQPEPKTIGSYARGRQLMAGNFLFAGFLVEAPNSSIWDILRPSAEFETHLHGFGWLDDLAAVGDNAARDLARDWLIQWLDRFGKGQGAGWSPELSGRRVIRWINHALFLLSGQSKEVSDRYFATLVRQTRFLSKRWHAAPAGLPRFEALTGLVYAGIALEGHSRLVTPASRAIAEECVGQVDPEGGIPSRNPEELLEVFTLLNWAATALSEQGQMPLRQHLLAIERIAPTLRALRHSDGGLARFHGGGRGPEGRLDQALASSGVRATANIGLAMGFARLSAGRTSIIIDTHAPPETEHSFNAHASTLGFELTSGRRPIIVNCGSGADFGPEWRRAGRSTPCHSTLSIDGYSSSRFVPHRPGLAVIDDLLLEAPRDVRFQQSSGLDGATVLATHDGYSQTHGLLHVRRLDLSIDGRDLSGEDTLGALSETDRITFEDLMNQNHLQGVRFAIRFHLHPDVEPTIDLGGSAVSLVSVSGEVWVFRFSGTSKLSIEPSVYLESGRLKPRATNQIVLSDTVLDYSAQVRWSLTRAQDGKSHIRDLHI
jgi:uncharacterized heparinase superfamily protein